MDIVYVPDGVFGKVHRGDGNSKGVNYLERCSESELKVLYDLYKKAESDYVLVVYNQQNAIHMKEYAFLLHMIDSNHEHLEPSEGWKHMKYVVSEDKDIATYESTKRKMENAATQNVMVKFSSELEKVYLEKKRSFGGYIHIVEYKNKLGYSYFTF